MTTTHSIPKHRRTGVARICRQCGVSFLAMPSRMNIGWGTYCCAAHGYQFRSAARTIPVSERFWDKVNKTDSCWLWKGARDPRGYGRVRVNGRVRQAHVVAWELTNEIIPLGLYACHHCDAPPYVRPDHLFLGSQTDNMQDASRKGRLACHVRGESAQGAKLSNADVVTIKAAVHHPQLVKELARSHGVSMQTIRDIRNGKKRRFA